MGEAKQRKKRLAAVRAWAVGSIEIEANGEPCFKWTGTTGDAIELQKRYLRAVETWTTVSAESYAKRVAGYLIAFGMPNEGDPDQRPSNIGTVWANEKIAQLKSAILWMVLHEHVPSKPGQRVEEVFVGKSLLVMLQGDRQQILVETLRELEGKPFSGENFTMMVGVLGDCPLDPAAAVTMTEKDMLALANHPLAKDDRFGDTPICIPRIPHNANEAKAMLEMATIFADMTDPVALANPEAAIKHYAGYTDDELRRGKPAVTVR
jgi:hypothetical protein